MLKLQLRPKPDAIAKSVSEEQDEPMKVERRRVYVVVIQVRFHVTGIGHVLNLGCRIAGWRGRGCADERALWNWRQDCLASSEIWSCPAEGIKRVTA